MIKKEDEKPNMIFSHWIILSIISLKDNHDYQFSSGVVYHTLAGVGGKPDTVPTSAIDAMNELNRWSLNNYNSNSSLNGETKVAGVGFSHCFVLPHLLLIVF